MVPKKELYSVLDLAKALSVSPVTIRAYIKAGILVPDTHVLAKDKRHMAAKFNQTSFDNFLRQCIVGDYNGEFLLSAGEAALILDISSSTLSYYVSMGLLHPDVVLPGVSSKRVGLRKFKISTIEEFVNNSNLKQSAKWKYLLEEYKKSPNYMRH